MYLEHTSIFKHASSGADNNIALVEHYGHSLIKECEIEIGGQKIDKHTSMWNRVYSDLTEFNPSGHYGGNPIVASSIQPRGYNGNGTLYQLMTGNGLGLNTDGAASISNNLSANGTGNGTINGITYKIGAGSGTAAQIDTHIFIPLNFWFNRNPGLALPLIALQYHEVKIKMTFETVLNLARTTTQTDASRLIGSNTLNDSKNFSLWVDYIYLDTDERRRFAQVSHEYLIEQLQYSQSTISTQNPSINLNFNHPIKELIWTMRNTTTGTSEDGGRHQTPAANLGDPTSGPASIDEMGGNWQLKLNGHDRFKGRDTKYFTRTQVWQHHTGYGGVPTVGLLDSSNIPNKLRTVGGDSIAVYSFALKPEEHQPSGTCNFSRIDNAQLVGSSIQVFASTGAEAASLQDIGLTRSTDVTLTIFAVNYNVLRIMSGMGGLAYSN